MPGIQSAVWSAVPMMCVWIGLCSHLHAIKGGDGGSFQGVALTSLTALYSWKPSHAMIPRAGVGTVYQRHTFNVWSTGGRVSPSGNMVAASSQTPPEN